MKVRVTRALLINTLQQNGLQDVEPMLRRGDYQAIHTVLRFPETAQVVHLEPWSSDQDDFTLCVEDSELPGYDGWAQPEYEVVEVSRLTDRFRHFACVFSHWQPTDTPHGELLRQQNVENLRRSLSAIMDYVPPAPAHVKPAPASMEDYSALQEARERLRAQRGAPMNADGTIRASVTIDGMEVEPGDRLIVPMTRRIVERSEMAVPAGLQIGDCIMVGGERARVTAITHASGLPCSVSYMVEGSTRLQVARAAEVTPLRPPGMGPWGVWEVSGSRDAGPLMAPRGPAVEYLPGPPAPGERPPEGTVWGWWDEVRDTMRLRLASGEEQLFSQPRSPLPEVGENYGRYFFDFARVRRGPRRLAGRERARAVLWAQHRDVPWVEDFELRWERYAAQGPWERPDRNRRGSYRERREVRLMSPTMIRVRALTALEQREWAQHVGLASTRVVIRGVEFHLDQVRWEAENNGGQQT